MNIDFEKLRTDLIDYFGSAMVAFPMAVISVAEVETASDEQLIKIAKQSGFDLRKYSL